MRTEKRPIIEQARTETWYVCEYEGCTYETKDRREAERHEWDVHIEHECDFRHVIKDTAPQAPLCAEDPQFLVHFPHKLAFDLFCSRKKVEWKCTYDAWKGPGWYVAYKHISFEGQGEYREELSVMSAKAWHEKLDDYRAKLEESLPNLKTFVDKSTYGE